MSLASLAAPAAALAALGTLLGYAARYAWICDLAGHFRAQYCLVLSIAAPIFWLEGWAIAGNVAAALAALNAAHILPLYVPGASAPPIGPSFRVLICNVSWRNRRHGPLLALISRAQPDLILLMETTPEWARSLEALDAAYPYAERAIMEQGSGIVLLSRTPFAQSRVVRIGHARGPSIIASVDVGGRPVTVVGIHPHSPTTARAYRFRNEQILATADRLRALPRPLVLMGDFNTTSWTWPFGKLLEVSGLGDSRAGRGFQPTWPLPFWRPFRIPIDHCLVSPEVVVLRREVGPPIGSDHAPVILECGLSPVRNTP
jgi:endonuclease/exonuclease/phosphatase (EEP) superfamily protein YafD